MLEAVAFVKMGDSNMTRLLLGILSIGVLFSGAARAKGIDDVKQVCGHSGVVIDYIIEAMGEKSKQQFSMSSLVGSNRRLIIYNDNSWILLLEYLTIGPVEEDTSCIIAKGGESSLELATDLMKRKTEWIGPSSPNDPKFN